MPLSVELGPGLLRGIFDGVQRPLPVIEMRSGAFIGRGVHLTPLYRARTGGASPPRLKAGDDVSGGAILGTVPETPAVEHRVMVPPDLEGTLTWVAPRGEYTIEEPIARAAHARRRTRADHDAALARAAAAALPGPAGSRRSR